MAGPWRISVPSPDAHQTHPGWWRVRNPVPIGPRAHTHPRTDTPMHAAHETLDPSWEACCLMFSILLQKRSLSSKGAHGPLSHGICRDPGPLTPPALHTLELSPAGLSDRDVQGQVRSSPALHVSRSFLWFFEGDKLGKRGGHLTPGVTQQEESRPLPALWRGCPLCQPPEGLQVSGFWGGHCVGMGSLPSQIAPLLDVGCGGLRSIPLGYSPLPGSAPGVQAW